MIAQPQINQNYKLFVGADIARSGGATAGTVATPGILASGEIVITDAGNVILDTTTVLSAPKIKIVMGRGATEALWQSQLFDYSEVVAYVGKPYAAKVQQVGYYGYNAVTNAGSFDVINDNWYTLVISFYELLSQEASALMNPIVVDYLSDASATQLEICDGLYHNLVAQLSYWTRKPILAERVSSYAGDAITGSVANFVVTQGSTTVTIDGTVTNAGLTTGYIRLGGTADTDPIYGVTAYTASTSIILDEPWQGASATIAVANVEFIPLASIADLGIKITGVEQPYVLDSRPPGLVSFQLGLKDGGSTPIASTVVSGFMGFGTYQLIRDNEAASWRDQGMLYTYTEFPPTTLPTNASSTQNYSVLNVGLKKPVGGQLSIGELPANLEIACALDNNVANTFDTNYDGSATGCVDVLDAYMSNLTAFSAQAGNL